MQSGAVFSFYWSGGAFLFYFAQKKSAVCALADTVPHSWPWRQSAWWWWWDGGEVDFLLLSQKQRPWPALRPDTGLRILL